MKPLATRRRLVGVGVVLLLLLAVSSACTTNEQDPLQPAGPFAREADQLWDLTFGVAVVIFFIVEGAIVFALVKFRHREGRKAAQFHGNTRVEILLTVIPSLILAALAVPTVRSIFELSTESEGINITVTAQRFWWEYSYEDFGFVTANELVIPTDQDINLTIDGVPADRVDGTAGVIHSFWIPQLGGTQDAVPEHSNFLKIRADEPGRFMGQCKEFCGLSHANMRIVAYARTPEDFRQWVSDQQSEAVESQAGIAAEGKQLFNGEAGDISQPCASCHSVQVGLDAPPNTGPNLAHFASRTTFAGATFERTDEHLRAWLAGPAEVRPGSTMPDLGLSADQIDALIAYLNTLE